MEVVDIVATLHMKERRCRVENNIENKTNDVILYFDYTSTYTPLVILLLGASLKYLIQP